MDALNDIVHNADRLALEVSQGKSVDKEAALALYHSAYKAFPAGGIPELIMHEYIFEDGSFIQVVDGKTNKSLKVDEHNKVGNCQELLPFTHNQSLLPELNLGAAIDCMNGIHGRTIFHSSLGKMVDGLDGSNLQWQEKSWSLPKGHSVLGESQLTRSMVFEPRKDLSLTADTKDGNDYLTITQAKGNGQMEKLRFSHNGEVDSAPVKLESLEIVNSKGAVVKSQHLELVLE
jgi:hypothetical protein